MGCYFLSVARINSSSIFGRRVLFLAAKTGTPFHFFLLKVEWGAVFGPFRFWHDRPSGHGSMYAVNFSVYVKCPYVELPLYRGCVMPKMEWAKNGHF